MTRALVPLADGVEEMEAVIVIDVLRRARWDVVVAGIGGTVVTASRGVRLVPDTDWSQIVPDTFDAIVLPGGSEGTRRLATHEGVRATVRRMAGAKKLVAAICAAPLVLQAAGVLDGRRATCNPGVSSEFKGARSEERVVVDGNIVTSQSAGTAFEFAVTLVRLRDGEAAAAGIRTALLLKD